MKQITESRCALQRFGERNPSDVLQLEKVLEQAEILIVPVEEEVKLTRRLSKHLSRSLLTEDLDPHTSVMQTSPAQHFLFLSSVSEIPKLSCKMATLICKGIT